MPALTSSITARLAAAGKLQRADRLLRLARGRGWLHLPDRPVYEPGVKPAPYLPTYEQLMAPLRMRRCAILELGVYAGDSLEMWRDGFPRATVVGIDLVPPEIDLGPRVHVLQGDQTDAQFMRDLRTAHAPGGFDVIIDDASHVGITTARSLQILFEEHLRPGGLYVIEDWGTGYLPDWHDGAVVAEPVAAATLDRSPVEMGDLPAPIPLPSHDLGMVGVVKRLVDHVSRGTIAYASPERVDAPLTISSMEVYDGLAVLRKAG